MKKFVFIVILTLTFIITPYIIQTASAQPPPDQEVDIPIDGGLGILIIAGLAFGAKRLHETKESVVQ